MNETIRKRMVEALDDDNTDAEACAKVAIEYANECMAELQAELTRERERLATAKSSATIQMEGLAEENAALRDRLAKVTTPPAPVARAFGEEMGRALLGDRRAIFAAMAMQGCALYNHTVLPNDNDMKRVAQAAVGLADALIAELAR